MNVLKPIFYLVLIGLLVTGSMTTKNNFLLKTSHAPLGIVSLELSTSTLRQQKILKEWDSVYINQQIYSRDTVITEKLTGLDTAIKQTKADYSFILFYVLFLSLLFFKYRKHLAAAHQLVSSNYWLLLSVIVFVAGILDLFENGQILKVLYRYNTDKGATGGKAIWIFLPALLKFLLLLSALIYFLIKIKATRLISVWLQKLSLLLKGFVYYGWKFRIVLTGLLTLFLLMAFTEQGKDLLVTINTSDWGIFWFFTATTVLALLNWYLPKIYDNLSEIDLTTVPRKSLKFADNDRDKLDLARFLGLLTFLIPAVGVLITMQAYHISYLAADISPLVILIITCILYLSALRYNWLDQIYKPKGNFNAGRYIITMVLVFGAIIYWGTSQETREPYYLAYLSLGFFLLSFAFVVTVSYRTCITVVRKIPIAPFIITAGILVALVFVAFNFENIVFYLTRYDRFYTLPIVIAALIAYTLFFSFLLIIGYKTKIQFITLFLLLVIYRSATSNNDFHKVQLVPKPTGQYKKLDLKSYTHQWLQSRRTEIAAFNKAHDTVAYPVFFVNAYGGGIKAAAWTTMVIGRLDQLLQENQGHPALPNNFQHYAFSYSGVSGGAVGLSLLAAARISDESYPTIDTLFYPVNSLQIYHHDYLTANLAALFGRDAFMALIGQHWYPDRARLQEKNWEFHTLKYGLHYATLLGNGWQPPQKNIPLFFSNTYDIKTGFKGILAPVRLSEDDFPGSILLQELIDENQDLYLSTAAFVSARFPYVSPTAKFDEQHHFTDGGTLENSGAETSLQVLTVFKYVLDSLQLHDATYRDLKIRINILSLPNSVPVMDSLERVKNLYEPLAPALGILNSTNGNTIKAETIIRLRAEENNWNYYSVNPRVLKIKTDNVWPVLPLGWQISDYALEQMVLSVTGPNSGLQPILQQFPRFAPKKE
ncbi:patatin-like phospholipase family protein [Pedobacter immunditicola]|uniref:patatin-like phospholipase family protein n=1 Tax=Pedobacter immunditicola TaxID=3133440 RepID=UPI0030ABDCC6